MTLMQTWSGGELPRMTVLAYVCECGAVTRRATLDGAQTMRNVFVRRPDRCRYVVVRMWWPSDGSTIWAIDLYECVELPMDVAPAYNYPYDQLHDITVGRYHEFPSSDAAIAACVMGYDTL